MVICLPYECYIYQRSESQKKVKVIIYRKSINLVSLPIYAFRKSRASRQRPRIIFLPWYMLAQLPSHAEPSKSGQRSRRKDHPCMDLILQDETACIKGSGRLRAEFIETESSAMNENPYPRRKDKEDQRVYCVISAQGHHDHRPASTKPRREFRNKIYNYNRELFSDLRGGEPVPGALPEKTSCSSYAGDRKLIQLLRNFCKSYRALFSYI